MRSPANFKPVLSSIEQHTAMLARRLACTAPRASFTKARASHRSSTRAFSSSSSSWAGPAPATHSSLSTHPGMANSVTLELDRLAPRFDIDADDVSILTEPKDFYNTIKAKILAAKKRIFLATLYVGRTEQELIDTLRQALREQPELQVSILTDALRGTRESPNESCASLLSSLARDFPSQVEIRMYHTPNLTGFRKRLMPKRLNEGWGLQHMKLYGFDDEIMLSGANLSDDYFTNRQDRYHVFSSKPLTDYFAKVYATMCRMSFELRPGSEKNTYSLDWPASNASSSPLEDPDSFVKTSRDLFLPLATSSGTTPERSSDEHWTSVYPTLIIPKAVNNELPSLRAVLSNSAQRPDSCMFTAGYFNPDPSVTAALLSSASIGTTTTVITASPWANGFYGSKGVSGMLPAAYTLLARRFLNSADKVAPGAVNLREWRLGTVGRPHGWTYHAKGVWLSYEQHNENIAQAVASTVDKSQVRPAQMAVTLVGSSNYTVRSYSLDTEVGAVVVSNDPRLCQAYSDEKDNLIEHTRAVTAKDLQGGERRVGPFVRIAMRIVQAIGGSL